MFRWRFDPGTAGLGVACLTASGVAWWLAGWVPGVIALGFALAIVFMAADRHPAHEDHTGPFARCGTGPQPVLRDEQEPAEPETIGDP